MTATASTIPDRHVTTVTDELTSNARFPPAAVADTMDIPIESGVPDDMKHALAAYFEDIAREFTATAVTSRDDWNDLEGYILFQDQSSTIDGQPSPSLSTFVVTCYLVHASQRRRLRPEACQRTIQTPRSSIRRRGSSGSCRTGLPSTSTPLMSAIVPH
jgi:hypothetical protein